MTREEIIRMAREAGIPIEIDWAGRPSTLVVKDGGTYLRGVDDLERFANLVAAAERERMMQIVQSMKADLEGRFEKIYMEGAMAGASAERQQTSKLFGVLVQISELTDLGGEVADYQDVVEAVKRIAPAEREACAKAAEDMCEYGKPYSAAAAIRARGEKE